MNKKTTMVIAILVIVIIIVASLILKDSEVSTDEKFAEDGLFNIGNTFDQKDSFLKSAYFSEDIQTPSSG